MKSMKNLKTIHSKLKCQLMARTFDLKRYKCYFDDKEIKSTPEFLEYIKESSKFNIKDLQLSISIVCEAGVCKKILVTNLPLTTIHTQISKDEREDECVVCFTQSDLELTMCGHLVCSKCVFELNKFSIFHDFYLNSQLAKNEYAGVCKKNMLMCKYTAFRCPCCRQVVGNYVDISSSSLEEMHKKLTKILKITCPLDKEKILSMLVQIQIDL